MAVSNIEWCDRVWNFLRGCDMISPGCKLCYAMKQAHRFNFPGGSYEGLTELGPNGPRWNGKVITVEDKINEPLHVRKPQRWFVNSMADLFHEDVPFEVIDKAFAVMAWTPQHTYQILTKRPERMREYCEGMMRLGLKERSLRLVRSQYKGHPAEKLALSSLKDGTIGDFPFPLKNVWLGVSVENQECADWRIWELLQTPAAVRFVSYEPALSPVNFTRLRPEGFDWYDALEGRAHEHPSVSSGWPRLDLVIVGGESGPGARPFNIQWALDTGRQCKEAGVAFFYKQGGSSNKCAHSSKGGCQDCMPPDLRIREFPRSELAI